MKTTSGLIQTNFSALLSWKWNSHRDIKGRTGLISENEIDETSDDIQYEFEELLKYL